MRTVLRYVDGRAIWSDNIPAFGGSLAFRGELVVGGPSRPPVSAERRAQLAEAARRYRQRQRETV